MGSSEAVRVIGVSVSPLDFDVKGRIKDRRVAI
jgi:hypothetical protein